MPRPYRQTARADAQDARRHAALDAVWRLWTHQGFAAVTLQAVADEAGLSLKSVVRYFGTKEGLLRACMEVSVAREEGERDAPVGDVAAVAAVLGARYEQAADWIVRNAEIEFRYPIMAEWLGRARRSHREWLGRAFAPWLPAEGPERERRLHALSMATELRGWWTARVALGASHEDAVAAMACLLGALVAEWSAGAPGVPLTTSGGQP